MRLGPLWAGLQSILPFRWNKVVAGDYNRSGECGGDPSVFTTPGITEGIRVILTAWAFLNLRHERLTVLAPTC